GEAMPAPSMIARSTVQERNSGIKSRIQHGRAGARTHRSARGRGGAVTPAAYSAAREAAAWRVRDERSVLAVSGNDRLSWLQGLLTNDIAALSGGGACYAAWLSPQGRMITD